MNERIALLVNSAIASDPVRMTIAFQKAVQSGRDTYELGLPEMLDHTGTASLLTGFG